ncbi:MAG: alkaline phosphatase family protein, partial [Pyrinomonadaceae bacterium]
GEPIWVTAEKQGQIAGSYFFVGTETMIQGEAPTHWRTYNGRVPNNMRVDKILGYLDLPVAKRPTMLSMYFSTTDDVGHEFGPDAEETRYAVWEVDEYIGRLMAGLKKRGIDKQVNIIITSDHGMAAVDQHNAIVMDEYFDTTDKKLADPIITTGEIWQIFPKPGKEDELLAQLKPIKNATCWRKTDIPARLNYSSGRRIAPIVCSSDLGWFMTSRERYDTQRKSDDFDKTRGAHGYDNRYQEMQATFIAHGAAFKKGFVADPFANVEVYNIMCKILGLKPAKNDGNLDRVKGMLR